MKKKMKKLKEPPSQLLLFCSGECGDSVHVSMPVYRDPLTSELRDKGWFLSVLTPPGSGNEPILFGGTCRMCAEQLMPEVVAAIDKGIVQ